MNSRFAEKNRHGDGPAIGIRVGRVYSTYLRCVPFSIELAPVIFGRRAASFDELKQIYTMARSLPARQIMHEDVATIGEDETIGEAVRLMMAKDYKHLPVVRDGKPVGMLARHDVLKLMLAEA